MIKKLLILGLCLLATSCASTGPMTDEAMTSQALQGEADAYNTGMRYLIGKGAKQDYAKAIDYFEKAAETGNPYAENELGYLYASGKGVQQDYAEAIKWYEKASNHGLASAQYNLGLMYQNGIGTPVDKAMAHKLFQEAASRGFDPAHRALTNG